LRTTKPVAAPSAIAARKLTRPKALKTPYPITAAVSRPTAPAAYCRRPPVFRNSTRAQSGHFMPTGVSFMHFTQMGVLQLQHLISVDDRGCLAQTRSTSSVAIKKW
jgi:hypothetical protein